MICTWVMASLFFFQHTGHILVYFRQVPVPCYCLTTGCCDYRCRDTAVVESVINYGRMATVNTVLLVI